MNETTVPTLRRELPELPRYMKHLPVDKRGYPVPWFVPWLDSDKKRCPAGEGEPEFRLMDEMKLVQALKDGKCWVCGGKLGRYRAYVIGPMCLVNRISAEPPSHLDCADFAARGCPFLTRPHMVRRTNDLPESKQGAGVLLEHNPGAMVVYVTNRPTRIKGDGAGGVLMALPEFSQLRVYSEGRQATIPEIERAMETGLPALLGVCQDDGERREVMDRAAAATLTLAAVAA